MSKTPSSDLVRLLLENRDGLLGFILAYIGMVPAANLVGFAGQELARKMPHMLGVLTETT